MIPVEEMHYHPTSERLVEILRTRVGTDNPDFFRAVVSYYLCLVAGSMRCQMKTHDRGTIPINAYAIGLGPSGIGKTRSVNVMEDEILKQFMARYKEETFPVCVEDNLPKLAHQRAQRKGTDPDEELVTVEAELKAQGPMSMTFDGGSTPALKQQRHINLMANCGSLNLKMDEIGDHLSGPTAEMFPVYLEMYDIGKTESKLTKQGTDNKRVEEIKGNVPANALMFGVPDMVFDGAQNEEKFHKMQGGGWARRTIFGYGDNQAETYQRSAEEEYDRITNPEHFQFIDDLSNELEKLADVVNMHKVLIISKELTLETIRYKQWNEQRAAEFSTHEQILSTEMAHRHYKALKLAGAYAFLDQSPEIYEHHFHAAIKVMEQSGECLKRIMTRERNHEKLARYIAEAPGELTQPDLLEDLPFYPKAQKSRDELMVLAIAHGYKNNIIIKRRHDDGVEFIRGESLKETDLSRMYLSYSNDLAENYQGTAVAFEDLGRLAQVNGLHWANHHFTDQYRLDDNAIPGFNLIVIDVDGGLNISTARMLLEGYKYFLYTTKRHTEDEPRFRIVFPTSHELRLDSEDYKEFMSNVFQSLPFDCDDGTGQRNKKWLTNNGYHEFNDGKLFDVLPFIPKTSKNESRKELVKDQQQMDNLERWVINTTGDGNRNNQLLKYAYILVDAGFAYDAIYSRVTDLNDKLPDKLAEVELINTVMVTVSKALAKKAA